MADSAEIGGSEQDDISFLRTVGFYSQLKKYIFYLLVTFNM